MIAVDTNVLVYAHREDSPHHAPALQALRGLAERGASWAVPWPCVHEFLAVVTHPKIFDPPSSIEVATQAVDDLLALGTTPLAETDDHARVLIELLVGSRVTGARIHDARVAALCLAHGVSELWTADRDFSYFPRLRTRNPLVG